MNETICKLCLMKVMRQHLICPSDSGEPAASSSDRAHQLGAGSQRTDLNYLNYLNRVWTKSGPEILSLICVFRLGRDIISSCWRTSLISFWDFPDFYLSEVIRASVPPVFLLPPRCFLFTVCLSVCLWAEFCTNRWEDFHETWWKVRTWAGNCL